MRWAGSGRSASRRSRGDGQVCPALGGGEVVNLIHDNRGNAGEGVAGGAGEHEVEGLGGGDEDVGRVADELAALAGGVSPLRTPTVMRVLRHASGVRGAQARDAGQWCPQVAFDVGSGGP